jgi:hypothetical protein
MKERIKKAMAMTTEERKAAKIEGQRKAAASGVPRDARGRILPGHSLNSLGRPKTALSVLCREQVSKLGLVRVLGAIAARSGDYRTNKIEVQVSDQIAAIKLLLLYGFGQPKAEIDGSDRVTIEVKYADNRSINIANAASGSGEDHSDVEEVQRRLLRPSLREDGSRDGSVDSSSAEG